MWSEHRAEAARRELLALGSEPIDVDEVHAASLAIVGSVVPFDAACVGAVDPDSLLLTSGVTLGFRPSSEETGRFVEIEYGGLDMSSFANLVDREIAVAHPGHATPSRRGGVRFNELTRTMGFDHDVRLTFSIDGACWAVGDLYRGAGSRPFERRELAFLESSATAIARATRSSLAARRTPGGPAPAGPAVVVMGRDGSTQSMTAAALERIGPLEADDGLATALRSLVAVVCRGAESSRSRLRIGGEWVVLRASALPAADGSDPVVVTIEPAAGPDMAELLVAAHGLTPRERDVCREVLAGRSTQEIAARLFIGSHTVQDHLKSVFAKTGVRSRRELVASMGGDPG